ncbi:MAG: TAXI family TRAP transporter solute-binding subunit [Granulosicoccus sp.]
MFTSRIFRCAVIGAAFLAVQAGIAQVAVLPKTMVWTSYDVGSAGYLETSAFAEALDKGYGTKVRIIPSDTSTGRLLPLQTGRATLGFMGNETYFAAEAMFEFAGREWGPQNLRVLLGRLSSVGLVTGENTEVNSPYDLKATKIGYVEAGISTTLNTETILAFGGLTSNDVKKIEYPSYDAMAKGFIAGEVDVVPATPTSAFLNEAKNGRGIRWISMPASDSEGWDRVAAHASSFKHSRVTTGVNISKNNPVDLLGYRYSQLTVQADADEEDVYNMVKAIHKSLKVYESTNNGMGNWAITAAGTAPAGAPFHPGAVRYLKEAGVWTNADELWNRARVDRVAAVQKAWFAAVAMADAQGVSSKDWPQYWANFRANNLD